MKPTKFNKYLHSKAGKLVKENAEKEVALISNNLSK